MHRVSRFLSLLLSAALLVGCSKPSTAISKSVENKAEAVSEDQVSSNADEEEEDPVLQAVEMINKHLPPRIYETYIKGDVSVNSWLFTENTIKYAYRELSSNGHQIFQVNYLSPGKEYVYAVDENGEECEPISEPVLDVAGFNINLENIKLLTPEDEVFDMVWFSSTDDSGEEKSYYIDINSYEVYEISENGATHTFDPENIVDMFLPTDYKKNMGPGLDQDIAYKMKIFTSSDQEMINAEADPYYPRYVYSGSSISLNCVHPENERAYINALMDATWWYLLGYELYGDIQIPCAQIFYFDDSDPELVDVWGFFGGHNYGVVKDTLEEVSYGMEYKHMVLERTSNGEYTILIDEYADTNEELSMMCEAYGLDPQKWIVSSEELDELQTQTLLDYLEVNKDSMPVEITGYRPYNGDIITLPKK